MGLCNGDGNTPLHYYASSLASETEYKSTIKLLVDSGCDPNTVNSKGQSIAHLAITQWVLIDMIKFFSELGGDSVVKTTQARPRSITRRQCLTWKSRPERGLSSILLRRKQIFIKAVGNANLYYYPREVCMSSSFQRSALVAAMRR